MRRLTTEEFIAKAKSVHGETYDYSELVYVDMRTNVLIKCNEHGTFSQKPASHTTGRGCPQCGYAKNWQGRKYTNETFAEAAKRVHGDFYSYEEVDYVNSATPIEITCPRHGAFMQRPAIHLMGHGCKACNESKGEKRVSDILEENRIPFESQWPIRDSSSKWPLKCDFCIPSLRTIIEYDGEFHFHCIEKFGGMERLEKAQERDRRKDKWAEENGYDLIRIPYTEFENIEAILLQALAI